MTRSGILAAALAALCLGAVPAAAEPAKYLFAAKRAPADLPAAAHGEYAKGCLAGGTELPETGPGWQAMRLSRNRNWGHPSAIAFIERLSQRVQAIGWPRLYIGDISQPRGGPMRSGHRSHLSIPTPSPVHEYSSLLRSSWPRHMYLQMQCIEATG